MGKYIMNAILPIALEASVLLKIAELKLGTKNPLTLLDDQVPCEWCKESDTCPTCEDTGQASRRENMLRFILERGDVILYREKGKTARAFNALAEAVAYLAFVPGGVKVFGTRYEETWEVPS